MHFIVGKRAGQWPDEWNSKHQNFCGNYNCIFDLLISLIIIYDARNKKKLISWFCLKNKKKWTKNLNQLRFIIHCVLCTLSEQSRYAPSLGHACSRSSSRCSNQVVHRPFRRLTSSNQLPGYFSRSLACS